MRYGKFTVIELNKSGVAQEAKTLRKTSDERSPLIEHIVPCGFVKIYKKTISETKEVLFKKE